MVKTAHAFLGFLVLVECLTGKSLIVHAQNNLPKEIRSKYSENFYIVCSGSGDTSESAAESARFEIAKYFESKISGETLVTQWAKSQSARGKTIEDRFTEFSNKIMISASREIPGIEIALTKYNKKSKTYEAWAALDKNKYSLYLREKIENIDSLANHRLANLGGDDLNLIRIYSQVMNDLLLREQARQDLSLLNLGLGLDSNQIVLHGVMTSLDSLIAEAFDVGIVFEGEVNSSIKSGIIKGINDAGIRVREYPDFSAAVDNGIDLLISVEHNVTSRTTSTTINKREFTFHFAGWVLSIKAMDPDTQKVINTFVQKDETNGSYEDQAFGRMVNKILQVQVPAVSDWVYESIFKPEG